MTLIKDTEKMEQMLIIAGGVALGGLAAIYRKPIGVGLLGLTGCAVLLVLGLWAANAFTEPIIQHMIAIGWPDARAYLGMIWSTFALLTGAFVFYGALQLIKEISQTPARRNAKKALAGYMKLVAKPPTAQLQAEQDAWHGIAKAALLDMCTLAPLHPARPGLQHTMEMALSKIAEADVKEKARLGVPSFEKWNDDFYNRQIETKA